MTYASQTDLVERYGESMLIDLTDRAEPAAGAIDSSVVDRALGPAVAAIDGYLKGRYLLPLAVTPPLLRDLAQPIAIYKLHRNVTSDKIRKDYEDAMRLLLAISRGDVRLDVAGVEPAASGTSGVRTSDRVRDLTPDNMKGFI
jgi:phage gp36-like protein